jgi:nucleoside-diphosphate-sugar epimerase
MKILVTGATGFLGKTVVREFLRRGDEVHATGKSPASDSPNYVPADVSGDLKCLDALKNIETIVHAAGLAHQFRGASREDFWRVNVGGTENVAKLARRLNVKNFILISSVAVYGRAAFENRRFEEEAACRPLGVYAESKLEAERAAREILDGDVNFTILRPSTIVGEGDRGNVQRLIKTIERGRFFWLGSGENLKSLVYKDDVARACAAVLDEEHAGERVFNVTAPAVKMREIVGTIEENLGKSVPAFSIPPKPLRVGLKFGARLGIKKIEKISETVEKWLSDDVFSGEKIASELNFTIKTDALEGIRREILYYKSLC